MNGVDRAGEWDQDVGAVGRSLYTARLLIPSHAFSFVTSDQEQTGDQDRVDHYERSRRQSVRRVSKPARAR